MWTCPECGREFKKRRQTHYCGQPPATVSEYISRQPSAIQPWLRELYREIKAAEPSLKEEIRWNMPCFSLGKTVLQFAAYKDYVSLYAGTEVTEKLRDRLTGLTDNKGTVRLSYARPVPRLSVREITCWCCKYYGLRG